MAQGRRAETLARGLLRTQSDARLAELARAGREAAFEEIVRRYRAPLVAFAAAYAPTERAEDVVQESLERTWTALRGSEREIVVKPWLYSLVRNAALNARRDARHHKPLDENVDGVRRLEEIVLDRDEFARVVAAVGALPDSQREALVRSALDGRTHDQIADALGTTPGSVRGLIHRARTAVRNGAGALVPLPLVRMLLETGTAEAGAGALSTAGTVGGAGLLAKGATVATIGALAIGSGVAIDRAGKDERAAGESKRAAATARAADSGGGEGGADRASAAAAAVPASGSDDNSGGGESGDSGPGSSERGEGEDDDSDGPGSGGDDSESEDGDDDSGPSPSSGSGGSDPDPDDSELDDSSDSGSSGSGSGSSGSGSSSSGSGSNSGSGSSGSGSDDAFETEDTEVDVEDAEIEADGVEALDDSSGSGSGSGSGDDDD